MPSKCSVYVIHSTSGHYKIGISNNPQKRLKQLQKTQGPYKYDLAFYWVCGSRKEAMTVESYFHNAYSHKRVNGEWFLFSPKDLIELGGSIDCARGEFAPPIKL